MSAPRRPPGWRQAGASSHIAITAERAAWPSWPPAFADRLYPLPRPMRSLGDYLRARHDDIALLTRDEARRELTRVRLRLTAEHDTAAAAWLREREARLVAALRDGGGE